MADARRRGPDPDKIEGVAGSESGAGRERPASVGRSPSQLAQQRAQRGVGGVASRGVHGRRFSGYRWGGGFGALPEGFQV